MSEKDAEGKEIENADSIPPIISVPLVQPENADSITPIISVPLVQPENADSITPIISAPLVQPNLRYNNRNSYQPIGYKPLSKETLISLSAIEPNSQSPLQSVTDPASGDRISTKRKSYLPVGFVLEPIKKEDLKVEKSDNERERKGRSCMSLNVKSRQPLVKIDVKRPVSFAGDFSSLDPERRNTKIMSRSSTFLDKSRIAASASKKKRFSSKSQKSKRNSMNPTLINLEAGLSITSKAKSINHSIVAKYTPDDPSYLLDPESMATLRAVFSIISAAYIGWCLYYQSKYFFANLVGWCWIGNFLYFLVSLVENLWYIDERQKVMFPYQPEITEALFVSISALAFTTPVIYWTFSFWPYISNLIFKIPNSFDMIDVQNLVGVHFALFLIIPEIFLSRRYLEKMLAVVPSMAVIMYMFLVWLLHYYFSWDWPESLSVFFISYFQWDISPISLFIAMLVTVLTTATSTIFVYWLCWWRDQLQKRKLEREEKKQAKQSQTA